MWCRLIISARSIDSALLEVTILFRRWAAQAEKDYGQVGH